MTTCAHILASKFYFDISHKYHCKISTGMRSNVVAVANANRRVPLAVSIRWLFLATLYIFYNFLYLISSVVPMNNYIFTELWQHRPMIQMHSHVIHSDTDILLDKYKDRYARLCKIF